MDEGIKVSSFDSAPNKDSREIFVNQAGTKEVAQALMDAVLDISGGEDSSLSFPLHLSPLTRMHGSTQ